MPDAPATLTLAELGDRFNRFADEARTYAGPLYAALSREIAQDNDVLALARHVRRPPVPNVLLASVHFLLAETPTHPLARFYGSLSEHPLPAGGAYPDFRDFVLANRATLIPLLETRITQTNEVGRCSSLMPALTAVHRSGDGRPLALIDVGCSAGLHLRWDRYFYDYGTATAGDPASPVTIRCELRGPVMPPLPRRFPDCVFRLGIDLNPVDLADPVERRWFEALIWPEHAARRRLAEAAIAVLLRDPPRLVKGRRDPGARGATRGCPTRHAARGVQQCRALPGGRGRPERRQVGARGLLGAAARCTGCTAKTKKCCCARSTTAT